MKPAEQRADAVELRRPEYQPRVGDNGTLPSSSSARLSRIEIASSKECRVNESRKPREHTPLVL